MEPSQNPTQIVKDCKKCACDEEQSDQIYDYVNETGSCNERIMKARAISVVNGY